MPELKHVVRTALVVLFVVFPLPVKDTLSCRVLHKTKEPFESLDLNLFLKVYSCQINRIRISVTQMHSHLYRRNDKKSVSTHGLPCVRELS